MPPTLRRRPAPLAIVNRVKNLLGSATSQLGIVVDLDLRPEGKNGPMSRTIASHEEYAQRWASTWERQAAVRARPIGDGELAAGCQGSFRVHGLPGGERG